LLHEESPGDVLSSFFNLLQDEPALRVIDTPDPSSEISLDEIAEYEDGMADDRLEFLNWWIDQYHREVARKHDSLTGLLDRNYWERQLYSRLKSSHSSRTIVLADIDFFKRFNDEYGHSMGDRVLEAVGSVMWDRFADTAHCVRYGGEEFLLVISGSIDEVLNRLEKFCETVRSSNLFENQPEPITFSLGVSPPSNESKTLKERIDEADLALYSSKNQGRDQITQFSPYMRHRETLSVWGFYRYWWGPGVQFAFKNEKTFYVKGDEVIKRYSWSNNSTTSIQTPEESEEIRSLQLVDHKLHILDESGNCWKFEGSGWTRLGGEDHPRLVAITGGTTHLLAAGLNNQLYRMEPGEAIHEGSLPERWDRLLFLDDVYLLIDDYLEKWSSEETTRIGLPASPLDFSTEDGKLVMSSTAGNLYVLDRSVNHWKQLILPDFLGRKVEARNVERYGDSFLIHDSHGRLFLAQKNHKSVPQKMELDLT
jgi:diguanylate cyclase (GGDEF)-like protein